jgi:putative two-component system response regulator
MADTLPHDRRVPPRVLILSVLALVVPVATTLAVPHAVGDYGALFWLAALIPAFALSFYRGIRGVASALVLGLVAMLVTYGVASWMLLPIPGALTWVVVAYLIIALWIAVQAEYMHRERDAVERMAFTDALTGLPNRRHALLHLTKEFAAAQRGRAVTVVLFDLDRFKQFNDTYGHAAGDDALRAFGEILAGLSRQMNLSGRLGGEEFVSILGGANSQGAVVFANRVCEALRDRNLGDGPLTVSAGVASFRPEMEAMEELLAAADSALYEAKRAGRDTVEVYAGGPLEPADPSTRRRHRDSEEHEAESGGASTGGTPDRRSASRARIEPSGLGRSRRVLLVESESHMTDILLTYLASEEFDVLHAPDVRAAFLELDGSVDILVSNLHLPGGGGPQLVTAVKARWPAIQVVVTTGVEGTQAAVEALRAGADSYLVKPFGVPELRRHLVEAMERRSTLLAGASHAPELTDDDKARVRARQAHESVRRGVMDLVRAAELRDPFTRGHSARVAAYAAVLIDGLDPGRSQVDRDRLQLACEVHDLGKIAVPDAILNKEGRLTEAEMDQVRTHPRVGRQMLAPLLDDELILGVVSWHHERWDGTGYPDHLAGQAIPVAARAVAVADTLDALTRPRAHRGAVPWDEAVEQILAQSGTGFDPTLVSHMERVLPELKRIHDESGGVAFPGDSVEGTEG